MPDTLTRRLQDFAAAVDRKFDAFGIRLTAAENGNASPPIINQANILSALGLSLTGNAGKILAVKADGTGFEFVAGGGTAPGDTTAPTITSAASFSVAENSPFSTTLTANETVTWTKVGGADGALFTLEGNTLSLTARDFEAPADADGNNSYVVQVRATDAAGNAANQTITVTVTDVAEGGGGIPAADNDFLAPELTRTSGPTAYPVTVALTTQPAEHMVGDTLRILVTSAVQEVGGELRPSGTIIVNETITLASTSAANNAAINAKLSTIASGIGLPFVRTERGAQASRWSIPVQYGTAAVPAITSPLTFSVTEGYPLAYTATTAAPVRAIYLVGQDGDRVEFTNAKPGSSFAMRFTGGVTKTFPADDFNTDNVYDIGLEVEGLNGVRSAVTSLALTLLDLDLEADQFDFANVADVPLNAYGQSPTAITVAGLTPGYTVPVSVAAGTQVSINNGAWVTSGDVKNDDTLRARVLTGGIAANTTGTVNYGGKTDNFIATSVGYTAPVLSTWAGSTGSGIADGSITLSNGGRTATMTRAEGPREVIGPKIFTLDQYWVEFAVSVPDATVFESTAGLIDDVSGKKVRFDTNSGAGNLGGGWDVTRGSNATVRFEVDRVAKNVKAFLGGVLRGTKTLPDDMLNLRAWTELKSGVGPAATVNTGQAAPMGTVTAGFQPGG